MPMVAGDVVVLLSVFVAILAIGAWAVGPTDAQRDARRRNPRGTAPDPWWRS